MPGWLKRRSSPINHENDDDDEEIVEIEDDEKEDSFDQMYKGEVSKSGAAILPSKRVRRIPDKSALSSKEKDKKIEDEIELKEEENKEEENLES